MKGFLHNRVNYAVNIHLGPKYLFVITEFVITEFHCKHLNNVLKNDLKKIKDTSKNIEDLTISSNVLLEILVSITKR